MVITVAIFTAMMAVVLGFFVSSNRSFLYQKRFVEVASAADAVMVTATEIIPPANAVVASHTFPSGTYTSDASTLVLELPAIDGSGTIISGSYDYVALYVADGKVQRVIEADSASARRSGTRALTDALQSIAFAYDNSDLTQVQAVTIDITASGTTQDSSLSERMTQTFRLRNAPQ
jgi:hypothetical protein